MHSTSYPVMRRFRVHFFVLSSVGLGACVQDSADAVHQLPTLTIPMDQSSTGVAAATETQTTASAATLTGSTTSALTTSSRTPKTSSDALSTTADSTQASTLVDSTQASTLVDSTSSKSGSTPSGSPSDSSDTSPEPNDCLDPCPAGNQNAFADCVVDFSPAPETANADKPFNHDKMPDVVLGPPRGTFDTVSLGCEGSLTVGFVDPPITNQEGADFIVFENPFPGFSEPVRVEVSQDGCTWVPFPCDPKTLEGCAAVNPVKANASNDIDPRDPTLAGGDAFDLETVGIDEARFVRVIDVSRAHHGSGEWCDPSKLAGNGKGGSDIDAIVSVHAPLP